MPLLDLQSGQQSTATRFLPKSEKALDPRQDEWQQQPDLTIVTISIACTGKLKGNFGQVTN